MVEVNSHADGSLSDDSDERKFELEAESGPEELYSTDIGSVRIHSEVKEHVLNREKTAGICPFFPRFTIARNIPTGLLLGAGPVERRFSVDQN